MLPGMSVIMVSHLNISTPSKHWTEIIFHNCFTHSGFNSLVIWWRFLLDLQNNPVFLKLNWRLCFSFFLSVVSRSNALPLQNLQGVRFVDLWIPYCTPQWDTNLYILICSPTVCWTQETESFIQVIQLEPAEVRLICIFSDIKCSISFHLQVGCKFWWEK